MRHAVRSGCAVALWLVAGCGPALAAEAKIDRLSVEPPSVSLGSADDRVQLVITAHRADGTLVDATAEVEYRCSNPAIASVIGGVVSPIGDGAAEIEIRLAGAADQPPVVARVAVAVRNFGVTRQLNFASDVEPILSKFSCNSGGCHGKATGQNGFKLSLLGFDPAKDYDALVKEGHGRRVSPATPDRSLLLLKATGQSSHGGSKRFEVDSPAYHLLRAWIQQGMPVGQASDPHVVRITVTPGERVLAANCNQQLRVTATFSDDSTRDVTAEAEYKSQQPDVLSVTPAGRITTLDATGDGTVMVRYMGLVEIARVVVPFDQTPPEAALAGFEPKNFIDHLVLAKWRKLNIAPSPRASDAEFLRRASLDCIGTLPTPEEVREFLADARPDKRAQLVDRLLERGEYVNFWTVRWGDLLRNLNAIYPEFKRGTFAFGNWIRTALAQNMPYDQFVTALLTAQGNPYDNPAVIWYRATNDLSKQTDYTCQLFLGVRLNCATCHHHPYERWSQDDYWSFAAFFARLGSKTDDVTHENAIFVRKEGTVSRPGGPVMKPKTLGGAEFDYVRGEDPRHNLAAWIASPDNPFFAKAISNRMWAAFMGLGLVESIDDMRVTNPPSNPELLDALAQDLVAHHFDLKHMIRTIMTSEVYGLSSVPTDYNASDHRNYARYVTRRMSAEVLSDAMDTLTGAPENFPGLPQGTRAIELFSESVPSYVLDVFGRSKRTTPCECERVTAPDLVQVLYLMNSPEMQNKIMAGDGRIARLVAAGKSPEEMVSELYLVAYGRPPNAPELGESAAYVRSAQDPRAALSDLVWSLLNSKEFLFNH